MSAPVEVLVHPSCFPDADHALWQRSFAQRQIAGRLHYSSHEQCRLWRAVHDAYAPSRTDLGYGEMLESLHRTAMSFAPSAPFALIGLGCGSGEKEAHLLRVMEGERRAAQHYVPLDAGLPLLLLAVQQCRTASPKTLVRPVLADLTALAELLPTLSSLADASQPRLYTLFGVLPNWEAGDLFQTLASVMRPQDQLLASANLLPEDAPRGLDRVLPQYDNPATHLWLQRLLVDAGMNQDDGRIEFGYETPDQTGVLRIVADFIFERPRRLAVAAAHLDCLPGERLRLFFSKRPTRKQVQDSAQAAGLNVLASVLLDSKEEMLILCRKG